MARESGHYANSHPPAAASGSSLSNFNLDLIALSENHLGPKSREPGANCTRGLVAADGDEPGLGAIVRPTMSWWKREDDKRGGIYNTGFNWIWDFLIVRDVTRGVNICVYSEIAEHSLNTHCAREFLEFSQSQRNIRWQVVWFFASKFALQSATFLPESIKFGEEIKIISSRNVWF